MLLKRALTVIFLLPAVIFIVVQKNNGLNLVIAANYGGQWDIVEATKKIVAKSLNNKLSLERIDTAIFQEHTALAGLPPVDLLIRTSGEERISNFFGRFCNIPLTTIVCSYNKIKTFIIRELFFCDSS